MEKSKMISENIKVSILILILSIVTFTSFQINTILINRIDSLRKFNGIYSLENAAWQVNLGSRIYQSYAHAKTIELISSQLERFYWTVQLQSGRLNDRDITNIIAMNSFDSPSIIIGAHYDCRMYADQSPDFRDRLLSVPGANDGASGVAILLELGRLLSSEDIPIWLVFFDAEDDGNINNMDWSMGSEYFVSVLEFIPNAVIILDMVGDRELDVYHEYNSDHSLTKELWNIALNMGYSPSFINSGKYSMIDDHLPFLENGISTSLIIDFDYPFWHTTEDTLDKLSSASLSKVGSVVYQWVLSQKP